MVRVVVVLLVILLVVGRLISAVELGNNSCLAQVDVFCGLSAVDIVAAVCMVRPHLVKVERLGILRILVAPLSVLAINIGGVVVCVNA